MQDNTHEHIDDALVQRGWLAMQQQLDVALPVQPQRKRRALVWWWTASAAALLLLVAGFGWWSATGETVPQTTALPSAPPLPNPATAAAVVSPPAPGQPTDGTALRTATTLRTGVAATHPDALDKRTAWNSKEGAAPAASGNAPDQRDAATSVIAPEPMAESLPTAEATPLLVATPIAPLLVPDADTDMATQPAARAKPWHGYAALAGGLDLTTQRPLAALSVGAVRQWRSGWGVDAAIGYQRHIAVSIQDTDALPHASIDGMGSGASSVVLIDAATVRYSRVQASLAATYRILPRVQVGLGVQGSRYLTAAVDAQYPVSTEVSAGSGNFSEVTQNGSLNLFDNSENELRSNLDQVGMPLDAPIGRWSAGVVGDVSVRIGARVSVQLQYQRTLNDWPFAAQRGQGLLVGARLVW